MRKQADFYQLVNSCLITNTTSVNGTQAPSMEPWNQQQVHESQQQHKQHPLQQKYKQLKQKPVHYEPPPEMDDGDILEPEHPNNRQGANKFPIKQQNFDFHDDG
jgi:hypothetical protein